MKNSIILFLLLAIGGCTNMQTVTSVENSKATPSNYKYYDSKSKIRYQVSSNEKYLFLTFNTSNNASIMKIVRTGLTIYFDSNGKKKKDSYVQYPVAKLAKMEKGKIKPDHQKRPQKMNLKNMISGVPREAIYFANETAQTINLSTDTSEFEARLIEENGALTYTIRIPFSKIEGTNYNSRNDLAIGVESGEFEMPSQRPTQSSGGQGGPGGKGGGGGGGQGGGGRPGGSGGGPGGGQSSEMTTPIKFWFRVSLPY
jgi:uncharacterized membrane protein YgcG